MAPMIFFSYFQHMFHYLFHEEPANNFCAHIFDTYFCQDRWYVKRLVEWVGLENCQFILKFSIVIYADKVESKKPKDMVT